MNEKKPELLDVKIEGEFKFTHRTNSRGSDNYITLESSSSKWGGIVATEGRHVKLPCKARLIITFGELYIFGILTNP